MSNVFAISWRVPCSGFRPSSLLQSSPSPPPLRPLCRISCPPWLPDSVSRRSIGPIRPLSFVSSPSPPARRFLIPDIRSFTNSGYRPAQSVQPIEHGVKPRPDPFSPAEVSAIFGRRAKITPQMGNRVLAVLHGRRVDGTLDLDLPNDIVSAVRPSSLHTALQWLRKNYPLDEDAAILARIEREEQEEERKLIQRAEDLGLYKPQSGSYGAELGESNNPYGRSILEETRQQNEAQILAEEEKRRQEWLEGEQRDREKLQRMVEKNTALQKYEETAALEVRERADPAQRPFLAWIQKHHLRATEMDLDVSQISTRRRLLPSLATTIVVLGLCYVFAENYEPPAKSDRMWPTVPPAAATVLAIMGANVGVFAMWRFWPPAWRMLNRYFITVFGAPRVSSLLGNIFSHQTFPHLGFNMLSLWVVGTRLHDDIGRGNFLAFYMASGVFASFCSLTVNVLKGKLMLSALGASGAIAGIVGAFCNLHSDDKLTIPFLPAEWRDVICVSGSTVLAIIVIMELADLAFPTFGKRVDHWAHLSGYLFGTLWATVYKRQEKERRTKKSWFERTFQNG